MSRSFGGTLLTTRSPMRISPPVMFSSPAIMRSKVDLPQPDGPTRTTNSPSPIAMSTPWMTCTAPNALRTSRIATDAMNAPYALPIAGFSRRLSPGEIAGDAIHHIRGGRASRNPGEMRHTPHAWLGDALPRSPCPAGHAKIAAHPRKARDASTPLRHHRTCRRRWPDRPQGAGGRLSGPEPHHPADRAVCSGRRRRRAGAAPRAGAQGEAWAHRGGREPRRGERHDRGPGRAAGCARRLYAAVLVLDPHDRAARHARGAVRSADRLCADRARRRGADAGDHGEGPAAADHGRGGCGGETEPGAMGVRRLLARLDGLHRH